jgi:hypothetical protein
MITFIATIDGPFNKGKSGHWIIKANDEPHARRLLQATVDKIPHMLYNAKDRKQIDKLYMKHNIGRIEVVTS